MDTYVVIDLSAVTFRRPRKDVVVARASSGEVLAVVEDAPADDREAALAACDEALGSATLVRTAAGRAARCRVAFYNPHAGTVAVGALPHTTAFTDHLPIELPAGGALANLTGTRSAPRLLLGDRILNPEELTRAGLSRVWAAHSSA